MATYKIDRSSSLQKTGKFKFDYQVNIVPTGGNIFQSVSAGGFPELTLNSVECSLYVGDAQDQINFKNLKRFPWGGNYIFGNFIDGGRSLLKIPITFFIKSPGAIIANGVTYKGGYYETIILYTEPYDVNIKPDKVFSGSVEGEFFVGLNTNEFVEIDEYYPSENYFIGSPVCPDNEDEYWKNKELSKETVRQWPKYTSLNWYETVDPTSKAYVGIRLKFTNPKGQVTEFSKSFVIPAPSELDILTMDKKFINAWTTISSNSGYVSISSNIAVDSTDIDKAQSTYSIVDSQNYSLKAYPGATRLTSSPKCTARIELFSDAPRKVSFESKILDWKDVHSDSLTAYVIGFNSDGKNKKIFRNSKRAVALPTYATVTTNSGNVGLIEQTYRNYHGNIEARDVDSIDSKTLDFNNQQKWIYGLVDTIKSKEPLDDLESPPKNFDFPAKFVRSTDGCYDINEINRELTLDKYDFPGSVPIPLRGWKFNSMSLKQDKEFIIEGSGNVRFFTGKTSEPHPYGDQNLSGYRYLDIELKSSNEVQSGNLIITETSKGPTLLSNNKTENIKSYKITTDSSSFKTLRIDLCNPDNKIDNVDNQDSPYPRLNTYTTSVPQSTAPFGYLSKENSPKSNFLVTKPNTSTESSNWITDEVKQKIIKSGFVYLTDGADSTVDYFEVNTSAFPKVGIGTNIIFGKPRVGNGKIKLAKFWNGDLPEISRKELFIYIPKNDLTYGKTIDELLNRSADGKYPDEFEVYDFDPLLPDISDVVSRITFEFTDGAGIIYINPIPAYENNQVTPYDGIEVEDKARNLVKSYKIIDYTNDVANTGKAYFTIQIPSDFNANNKFSIGSTIRLKFLNNFSDDRFSSVVVKFDKIEKYQNFYRANIEYAKVDKNSPADAEGIPRTLNGKALVLSANAPIITVKPTRLVEKTFPANTILNTNLITKAPLGPEVNAIDDAPQDEASNGPYYGISRIAKIEIDNEQLTLGQIKLVRDNSLSNFVTSGNNNTFEEKTKYDGSSNSETFYYTRRFWQQNTDGKDEEEGDITWQNVITPNLNYWTLSPKSISELCDDISKVDSYVNPRWLDPSNTEAKIIRHPGWHANKFDKSYPVDSITGNRIYGNKLDPEYLNSDTGYATWVYGNGILGLPSGKNSGSGTSYLKAIDISFNDLKTILAQTIFHRINADFPPGKPDLFGNTSLRNEDGTIQESTLHLRGGFIARGPGHGLILPPQKSTADNLRKANLIEKSTLENKGSSESDAKGYFETSSPYGKNKRDHYIELEKSKNFVLPSDYRSSTRNMSQSKRERAAFKGGKQNVATNLSACESGFEKSIVIAYTIPTTKPNEENQTGIISTDSFYNQQYEKYPVGFNTVTGTGVTIKGEFPFVLASETHINQSSRINTFLLTERNSNVKATSSHDYDSLIAANTDMRNKLSWHPYIEGQAKTDLNFSTLSKAFKGTKFNSYAVSDQAPQLFNVGYADPGAIVFRSISLSATNVNAPLTDKTIFIDGIAPTYISDFRLLEPITSSGTAYSSFPTVAQISSRDYIVAYSLNASPRKINFKIISNYQAQDKNTLFDLDALTGNTLSDQYNIYGLTSDYDERLGLHRSVFWCNGGIYYFEYALTSSSLGKKRSDKLHLIKGKLDEKLVSELINRRNIVTYYNSNSELNAEVPKQKPALITCKKQEYSGKVFVAYDTGKCNIEAVLFHPYSKILGTRKFDIECVNDSGSNIKDTTPIANIQANPTSGQSALLVNFLSTNSYDPGGSTLTYAWNFGDETQSTEENPAHTFVNSTTDAIQYKATLIVTNTNGISSNPATITITVNPAPVNNLLPQAKFDASPTSGDVTLTVTFTDQSTPINDNSFLQIYEWDFGDGNTAIKFDNASFNYDYTRSGTFKPTLKVKDNLARISNIFTGPTITVNDVNNPPANQPPVALFTIDANNVFAPALINFTDASTDSDDRIESWLWEFETGRSAFYNAQTYQKTISYTFDKSGTYPVKLTVKDSGNLSSTYILNIIIKNNAPIAILSASPNPVLSQSSVSFFGNNSYDSDGNIVKYAWDFGDGAIIAEGKTSESHIYSEPGFYRASLTVTDNIGDSSTANIDITVTNRNPVARITYTSLNVKAPGSLAFNGDTSSDPDGTIVSYNWTVSNGLSATTPNATFAFTSEGSYIVTLLVTDNSGGTNSASVTVTVTSPDNILPIAILNVDKNSGLINETFEFNVSNSSDPDGNIVLYQLDFGDGTLARFATLAPISHIYKSVGVFTAKLSATDNRNGVSVETLNSVQKITINNQPPIASFSFSPINALTFDPITFTDTSTDPDNSIMRWSWNYGDGTTFTTTDPLQKSPQKSYDKGNKDYTVSLTVYDNFGLSSTISQPVRIENRKPFAVISTNKTPTNNTIVGISPFTVIFDSNSYDLDGTVANYEWSLSGISATPITTKSFTYTFTNPRFIPFSVTLRVQDDDGAWSDLANIGVKVNFPNVPPVASIGANPPSRTRQAPVTVDFTGAGSYDPDNVGGPLIYSWDFGNGNTSDLVNPTTVYSQPGTYKVSLTVTDNLAATNTATLDYIVLNNKPVALLDTVPSGIVAIKINTPIVFTSSGSFDTDINQFINGYKWLKDGVNQNSNTPTFETSFNSVGNHTITLSVFDNLGLESDLVNKTVFVFDDPTPPLNQNPIAILGNEPTVTGYIELKVGDSFTFDGANSYDIEDGSNVTYEWSIDGVKSGFTSTFTNQFNVAGIFTISLVVFDTKKLASTTATNLGNRNEIQVNVSAVSNPLTNKLFSTGRATFGAISSGSNTPDRYGFELVDDTKQFTIIEAGLNHTFVVDADGKLYASGSNSNGQLGFPSNITQINSLTIVPLASKYKVVKVSAGDDCSAIIAEDTTINKRVLLVCGSNVNGIFGNSLSLTNIYNFQPILERALTNNGTSYLSNNSLLDVSCNSFILAFTDNKQVWIAGLHNYVNKTGISDTGFFPINIDPNPDKLTGSTNYLNPFKLEVGFKNFSGFVSGLSYDIDNQIVWFAGLSNLRGWGYAYDISTYENTIIIISASTDPYWDHAIVLYGFSITETPQYDYSPGLASDLHPGENYIKISTGKFGFLALSENLFYPYGDNSYGALGIAKTYTNSVAWNLQYGLPSGTLFSLTSVVGASNIAAGGDHSIILASNIKPSGYSFNIIRPGGYPYVDLLTQYSIDQITQ